MQWFIQKYLASTRILEFIQVTMCTIRAFNYLQDRWV